MREITPKLTPELEYIVTATRSGECPPSLSLLSDLSWNMSQSSRTEIGTIYSSFVVKVGITRARLEAQHCIRLYIEGRTATAGTTAPI